MDVTVSLSEVRGFMEELSPELGFTDPISGNIVSKVGYHDWYSFKKESSILQVFISKSITQF